MKKHTLNALKTVFAVLFLLHCTHSFSQNDKEVQEIIKNYDLKKIKKLQDYYIKKVAAEKKEALEAAKRNNWPIVKIGENGSISELMKLTPDGFPIYYSQDNVDAARSTRANILQNTFNVKGEGMVARVWDGGKVRASHQEFGGRVTVVDDAAGPSGNNFHATHVTGTVIASGVQANAKGMAPMAQARTFNWTDDIVEAMSEVQLGMLLSNHSYGVPSNSNGLPSWYIGAYTDESRQWDELAYVAPYYLMVVSAGNNGGDMNSDPSTPGQYDKLTGNKVSKNNLVVANANDALVLANGNLLNVAINPGSSQGPADDNRIKPDIAGNGLGLYSCLETSNTAYGSLTGTSMASPNVMGTLLLVQQLYNSLNMRFMKAATLKALACHTADDAGNPGPDVRFGWGLLNGKKAGETITGDGLGSVISEETLVQGQTYSFTVKSDGVSPLSATVAWTDVPGQTTTVLNNPSPRLVNDLDVRITKGSLVYYPWSLQSAANLNAVKTVDNNVDNIERVDVTGATGEYTVTVTHKGTLQGGSQDFSIIVTGATSSFAITPTSPDVVVCGTPNATYTFNYKTTTTTPTAFSVVGAPVGATINLSTNSLSANGQVTMTITNLQNVAAGKYLIGLKGIGGTETEIKNVNLRVFQPTFTGVQLTSPANNQEALAMNVNLEWQADINATSYIVQVSANPNFSSFITNTTTNTTRHFVSGLNQASIYYWRVLSVNSCGQATTNNFYRFDTGTLSCGNVFSATDFSNATIGVAENSVGFVPINVTGGISIGGLTVNLNLNHEYLSDVSIHLDGPVSLGSPSIVLFDGACSDKKDINATVSDNGVQFTCANMPAISGTVLPEQPLGTFNNLIADGEWKLRVVDYYEVDGGQINSVTLNFCNVVSANLSVQDQLAANVSVFPNPTKGTLNIQLPDNQPNTTLTLFDVQGRMILTKKTNSNFDTMQIGNLQEGVYVLSIENEKYRTTKKIVLNK